jgi:hypothetical protein
VLWLLIRGCAHRHLHCVHAHCSSDTHIGLPHHYNPLIDPIDGYQGRDHAVITWRWFLTVRFGE